MTEFKSIQLINFNELAREFNAPDDIESYKTLKHACAINNIKAEIKDFEPVNVPAMLVEDSSLNKFRESLLYEVRTMNENDNDAFAGRFEKLLENAANKGVDFYLNSSNNLIKALVNSAFETQVAVCLSLYHITYMTVMPSLKRGEVDRIYDSISSVLNKLLELPPVVKTELIEQHELEIIGANNECKPIRLFLMTPFDDRYSNVIRAIKLVFETSPYFFEVMIATDKTYDTKLLPNVKHHIKMADGFIAEITDLNPNVMLELGAILINNDNRPVFSLRGNDASKEVPVDINDQLYINYGNIDDSVEEMVNKIKGTIERHGKPSHDEILKLLQKRTCKALNFSMFSKLKIKLQDHEISSIVGTYSTVENFIESSSEEISKTTAIDIDDINFIKTGLKRFLTA